MNNFVLFQFSFTIKFLFALFTNPKFNTIFYKLRFMVFMHVIIEFLIVLELLLAILALTFHDFVMDGYDVDS